jgi:hypothetical protein
MVVALAGRRVDSQDTHSPRFPAANVPLVRRRIRESFETREAHALICSAACGADLLALESAGQLGIRRRVVLPFARDRFRETSVIDRSEEWGARYDRVLDEVEDAGDLIVLGCAANDPDAYDATNCAVLDEAVRLARELDEPVLAIVVWNGAVRGESDFSEAFRREAEKRGLPVVEIDTL